MGGGDKAPKNDIGVLHCDKSPYTDPLNFNISGYIFLRNIYGNPILLEQYIKGRHYGVILRKGGQHT